MNNSEIVTKFCATWAERDIDKLMEYFTDDAVYHNIPIDPPSVGKEQIRAVIESFTSSPEAIEFAIHYQAESTEGLVMNERTDTFKIGDTTVALRIMGIFEIRDGKISAWRDYFDLNQYMSQLPQQ